MTFHSYSLRLGLLKLMPTLLFPDKLSTGVVNSQMYDQGRLFLLNQ